MRPFLVTLVLATVNSAVLDGAVAAAPTLQRVSPRGLQIGGTTTLVLDGEGLLPAPQLLVSGLTLAKQTIKPGATARHLEIEVTLDASATAGISLLRVAAPDGVSNGQAIVIGTAVELPVSAQVATLPVSLNGNIVGSTVAATTFIGQRGQRVVIDVVSRRLDAALRPAVHVYNARGTQLAWSPGLPSLVGDARCQLTLPADGEYRIELHDSLFRGAEPGHFHLSVGDLNYADFAYPLGAQRGGRAAVELVGTRLSPDHARAEFAVGPIAGSQQVPWPSGELPFSGGRPCIVVNDYPEQVESASAAVTTELSPAPVAVSGRLLKPGEVDAYRLPVVPGQKLRFELLAERLRSPVDGVLSIEKDSGGQLATNDDRPGTKDPGLDYTVPPDTRSLLIKIRDLYGAGGPEHLYRLSVVPADAPDFALGLASDRVLVPRGGAAWVRVKVQRQNYPGPIKLTFDGLPADVTVDSAEISAGADQAIVSISAPAGVPVAAENTTLDILATREPTSPGQASTAQETVAQRTVAQSTVAAICSLRGESVGTERPVTRLAQLDDTTLFKYQPWLRSQLAAAVIPAAPLALAWEPFSTDAVLVPGTLLPVKVQITRAAAAVGAVRVSLVTSQTPPKTSVKVRNVVQTTEVVERTIRLAAELVVPAGESAASGTITVPGDLPLVAYDLALQADLLATDNKTVVASAFTPVRRLPSVAPLKLELTSTAGIEARAGDGPAGKLTGKIVRAAGFTAPVKVVLAGLPKGVISPNALLSSPTGDFELSGTFVYGTPPGELKGIKLVAVAVPDPKYTQVEARSNEIPVAVKILPGEKPTSEPPLAIFEDQPEFIANLTEGSGHAELFTDEKFSGKASCKVAPDQRSNPAFPGMAIKIREKPGAGEFRYLQFAWKKKQGDSICLQLGHDGKFGPVEGNPGKFRYHAGPGPECYGASVAVEAELPAEFTLVTRDLFADFGEFTLTGLGLSAIDPQSALFDHIYLGKKLDDFQSVKP